MTTRITYLLLFFLFSANLSNAQTGHITGFVKTSDGRPAEAVSLKLKGSTKAASSNKSGKYTLKNVKPGLQTVTATFIGLQKQEQSIQVNANDTVTLDFVLKENASELQEVIVSSRNSNKVNTIVAKMPLKNLENPQIYSSISSELLKQQVITTYDDAMRNVPGISRTWASTGRGSDGGSYFALRGFEAQPTLYNGLPGITSGNLDPADVEEIQVIKGPSATLFGGSYYNYGGIINTITKKPHYNFAGDVSYTVGSFGLHRIAADINTPLSKTEKIAFRLNTAYQTEDSFQDAGFKKSVFVAPSFVYEVNDRLSIHLMAQVLEEKRAVAPIFFHSDRSNPLPFKTVKELNLNNNLSFTSNDLTIKNPKLNVQGQVLYKISDQWNSQTAVSAGRVKSDGVYTYIIDENFGNNWFAQSFHIEDQVIKTIDVQQNFNGDFKIGNLRNRLIVGLDFFHRNVVDKGSGYAAGRNVSPQGEVTNYVEEGNPVPLVELNRASIDNLLANKGRSNSNVSNSTYSAYFSNVLNLTPQIMAMVSLRTDYFDSKGDKTDPEDDYNQFALSPKFGLVYQAIPDKVSVFANYMNAFVNVAPRAVYDDQNVQTGIKSFKPEHANQLEFGVKTSLLSDKLNATVSIYDIKLSDRVYPDQANMNNSVQGGKVGSRGIEIDITAHPTPELSIIAGYSYNRSKILEGNQTDFYSQPGRNPGGQGPQNLANLWATYKFSNGTLRNFGIGIGGNYAGKYKVIDNSATGVFTLPDYALLNTSIFHNSKHYRITFNVNNLTNKEYYIGYWSINPQKRRNFATSLAYKF